MKPKVIGIVGGAGPLAGARLLERLIQLSNRSYGCYADADYPQILLNSFPFSDMLTAKKDSSLLKAELSLSLNQLRAQGAEVLAIACNTLHNFLEVDQDREDLINLPRMLKEELASKALSNEQLLVFCTTTSRENALHKKYFECSYPEPALQNKLDLIIDRILRGEGSGGIVSDLLALIEESSPSTIVLGCTELSLYAKELAVSSRKIIDPLTLLAEKILETSFKERS